MQEIKNISLKDIADKAGVSTALVSFVLNGKGKEHRVGEETAKHIQRIALEMNYHPNMAAKNLRSGKTGTIGVVVSDISNPFFAYVSRFIEDEAAKKGYAVLFGSSDEDAAKMQRIVASLINKGVDGMIVVPCEKSHDIIEALMRNNTPLVIFDRPINDLNISYVALNNFEATYKATIHLLEAGFSSPGLVGYDIDLFHMQERIKGYKKAMADNGLKGAVNVGFLKHKSPRKGVDRVISNMMSEGVDAIISATNAISLACMHAIRDLDIKVPTQLGLVGFDGNDAFEFFYSPVTFVKQPIDILAQKAVEIIVDAITNDSRSIQSVMVEAELVKRESSKRTCDVLS